MKGYTITLDEHERALVMRLLTEYGDREPGDPQAEGAWDKLNLVRGVER